MRYWELHPVAGEYELETAEGKYVIHRHADGGGVHLDLRYEVGDKLSGFRIPVAELEEFFGTGSKECEPKGLHPVAWLEVNTSDCTLVERGVYGWRQSDGDGRVLVLRGEKWSGTFAVRRDDTPQMNLDAVRRVAEACGAERFDEAVAQRIVSKMQDGESARHHAVERLCGVGREVDGERFDEELWRRSVAGLSLREIQAHVGAYEKRFDEKYPLQPVTKPEPLDVQDNGRWQEIAAMLTDHK